MRIRKSTTAAVLGLAALALSASACSSSGSGSTPVAKKTTDTASDTAYKYRQCLRAHGMNIVEPAPGADPHGMNINGNYDAATFQKALEACKQFSSNPSGQISQADKDKALKYAKCMRANGYNMPDPVFGGAAQPAQPGPTGAAKNKYDKANAICSAK